MLTKEQLDDLALRCKKHWRIRYDEIEALIEMARCWHATSNSTKPQVAERAAFG